MDLYPQNRGSGLTRYRSAPSSFFDNLIDASNFHGEISNGDFSVNDDCLEMENLFGKCLDEDKSVKEEEKNNSELVYRNVGVQNFGNGVSFMDNRSFGVMENLGTSDSVHNRSNLTRQNSSPEVFLSNLGNESGGLDSHMNLPYVTNSRHMPLIAEDKPESNSIFPENSWNKSSFNALKRTGEQDITFSRLESRNANSNNRLAHHMSLPTTFSERATRAKVLNFQSTVPCKIRAKRGFATHPRSVAERVRRTRISERMRKLQDLFPTMDKQTTTADMLEMAVAQIKELQKQVKALTGTRARCTCAATA